MASLDDFNEDSGVTLDDMQIEGELVPVTNPPSNQNLAAYSAVLSGNPESVETTYLSVSGELDNEGESRAADEIVTNAKSYTRQANTRALEGILTDPDLSDEQKQQALNNYYDEQSSKYSVRDIVATESAIAPAEPDETLEAEKVRINTFEGLQEVKEWQRYSQSVLNSELNSTNPNMAKNMADLLEVVLPFGQQKQMAQVMADLREGDAGAISKALVFLGDSKSDLREMMMSISDVEQRKRLGEIVRSSINDSSGIVLTDENDFLRKDAMMAAFDEGYYGEGMEFIDNAISLLDITMLGGLISRPIAAGQRTARAARIAEREAELSKNFARAKQETGAVESAVEGDLRAGGGYQSAEQPIGGGSYTFTSDAGALRGSDVGQVPAARGTRAADEAAESAPELGGTELRAGDSYPEGREIPIGGGSYTRTEDAAALRSPSVPERMGTAVRDNDELAWMSRDKRAVEIARGAMEDIAKKRIIESSVSPVSVSQVYRSTNPAKARAASTMVEMDLSGEVARALYGTSRTEAIAFDHLGGMEKVGGAVTAKVSQPDVVRIGDTGTLDKGIAAMTQDNGAIYISQAVKEKMANTVINDFANASGIVSRTEMTVPKTSDLADGFSISSTYGPRDGGWTDAASSLDHVKRALRHYGVGDDNLKLLARQGDEYVEVDKNLYRGEEGDYLVRVDYDHKFAANDLVDYDAITVKRNMFDRIPHTEGVKNRGSIQRHLLPPTAMLDNLTTMGAARAQDKAAGLEKALLKTAESFGKKYNKLNKQQQALVESEIRRANAQSRNAPDHELVNAGMNEQAISALKDWRHAWDQHYWLENQDMVRTLRNGGWGMIEEPTSSTRLIAKERKRAGVPNGTRAYDIEQDAMVTLTKEDLDKLYEAGDSVAVLRGPIERGDEMIESVISRGANGSTYVRRLRDEDKILNYREGYYTVYYDAPKMVDKFITKGGKEYRSTVMATDMTNGVRTVERLNNEAEEGTRYVMRDARERHFVSEDENWGVQSASGRLTQRVRGERLEDATSNAQRAEDQHVLGPMDSLLRSARSTAARTSMRDYLEFTKARIVRQFGDMMPKDKFGRPTWTGDASKLRADNFGDKSAADARTAIEYINSLEHGYINSMDEGIKYGLGGVADAAGRRGLGKGESFFNSLSKLSPAARAKSLSFHLYLALNPQRQFVVQAHQALQNLAINPAYFTTRLAPDTSALGMMNLGRRTGADLSVAAAKMSGRSVDDVKYFSEAYDRSGLSAAIDKQNLVRDSMTELANDFAAGGARSSIGNRIMGGASSATAFSRKIGFDAGEEVNMMTAWLTMHDKVAREVGKTRLNKVELDRVGSLARTYTYNMNRAGDMPYNENFLAPLFQFMQVPHKAVVQPFFDRTLSRGERARLASFNLLMYGLPTTTIAALYGDSILPEDPEARDFVMQGLEGYALNKMMREMTGDDTSIDFSSLAATDSTGLMEFFAELGTGGAGKILSESPSGALFFGHNPRITNAAKAWAEYFHFRTPTDGEKIEASEAMIETAKLASGFSNWYKARLMREGDKLYGSSGALTDEGITYTERMGQALGLSPMDAYRKWNVSSEMYEARAEFKDDVDKWYAEIKRELTREGMYNDNPDFGRRVLNQAAIVFKDTPKAYEQIRQKMKYDVEVNKDDTMFSEAIKMIGVAPDGKVGDWVNTIPFEDETKRENLRKTVDFMQRIEEE